jgi:hypothetical protein
MDMSEASVVIETLLVRNLLEVFGEHDPAKRRAVIGELFTEDFTFTDPNGRNSGHEALDEAVTALHKLLPGYVFKTRAPPQTLEDAGRLAWAFGPPEDPERVTGLDVIAVRGGRIAALYTFLDHPPA